MEESDDDVNDEDSNCCCSCERDVAVESVNVRESSMSLQPGAFFVNCPQHVNLPKFFFHTPQWYCD